MFGGIKRRVQSLKGDAPACFIDGGPNFADVPDSQSVAIVCSHQGVRLYALKPGRYQVHETEPQVNSEPLKRYRKAVAELIQTI